MAQPLIIANWKANPDSPGRALRLARDSERGTAGVSGAEIVIAPPMPFLESVRTALTRIKLGAQDAFWGDIGPFTGETSWHQLKHLKVSYIIVGHSERRMYAGETDETVHRKIMAFLAHGFNAVLCIGEREREGKEIPAVVGEQLTRALLGVSPRHLSRLVVAYEPIWAISTNLHARPDTPDNAFRALVYIRKIISGLYKKKAAHAVRVIYGGSVSAENIAGFIGEGGMQGALVGGASLSSAHFSHIVKTAASVRGQNLSQNSLS